jgi:hypothetical protein
MPFTFSLGLKPSLFAKVCITGNRWNNLEGVQGFEKPGPNSHGGQKETLLVDAVAIKSDWRGECLSALSAVIP